MAGVINFGASAGILPREVLARARDEMPGRAGDPLPVMELPFTGRVFAEIQAAAAADLRDLLNISDDYRVLFLQGGASAHFAAVPMNLLRGRTRAAYVETGHWARRAMIEAARYCGVFAAASGAEEGFTTLPPTATWRIDPDAAYCHITTNETAQGLQFRELPAIDGPPLVADMTSDFLSRPLDVTRFGLIYASAQKNVGPAGLTIVIARSDLLGSALPITPSVFDYARQAEADSRVNTPPTYAVYIAGLVFAWLKRQGGLPGIERRNRRKSDRLYAAIDASALYRCPVAPADRSRTNVCFHLAEPALEPRFHVEAERQGLLGLQGHPAVGGIRASLYNAMPEVGVDRLIAFLSAFERRYG